jgi:transposase InsO family protein
MPWNEVKPMNEKIRFIADYMNNYFTVTELCERYNISRKTGYKWIQRFVQSGIDGLKDHSRRPIHSPNKTPDYMINEILALKSIHPSWGAKKLLWRADKDHPDWQLPSIGTTDRILKKNGLVKKRRKSMKRYHYGPHMSPITGPNDTWTTDFKGHFKTLDGIYCYPLTIADGHSRFILACEGFLSPSLIPTKQIFKRIFEIYGLPNKIRSDNGTPFASVALGRLTRLSVWWIRLGIIPELIEPGCPQQNGIHERMHRTLKEDTVIPPAKNIKMQQLRFDHFVNEFNYERPHESLGMTPPADVYTPSLRPMPKKLPQIEYPYHFEVRLVSDNGGIRWSDGRHRSRVGISTILNGQYVGLEEVDNGVWDVYFGPIWLGRLDEKIMRIIDKYGDSQRTIRDKNYQNLLPMS